MIKGLDERQKPALLIVEMQQAAIDGAVADGSVPSDTLQSRMVPAIAALAEAFRDADAPVVHCTLVPKADYRDFPANCERAVALRRARVLYDGAPGARIVQGLAPSTRDIVVQRRAGVTPFHATELERVLRTHGVGSLVLAGLASDVALLGTVIEAVNRLLEVILPIDCVAATALGQTTRLSPWFASLASISESGAVARKVLQRGWNAAPVRDDWDMAVATYLN